jgi:hypothetical protein
MNYYQKAIAEITKLLTNDKIENSLIVKVVAVLDELEDKAGFQPFSPINIPEPAQVGDVMLMNYNNPQILNDAYFAKELDGVLTWVSEMDEPMEYVFAECWGDEWQAEMDGCDYLIVPVKRD